MQGAKFFPFPRSYTYAPINTKPHGGGGGKPGEFDIFTRARVKFPTPGQIEKVKFPPLGTTFFPKPVLAMSKSPPREKLAESISRG